MGDAVLRQRGPGVRGRGIRRADAFLFGRKTYDIFAGYWGVMDPSENAFAEALNTKPKYVASSTN
jgi:dihydrofolate reductase